MMTMTIIGQSLAPNLGGQSQFAYSIFAERTYDFLIQSKGKDLLTQQGQAGKWDQNILMFGSSTFDHQHSFYE